MKKDELIKIAKNFSIDGEPVKIEKCNSGHINKTYAITYKTKEHPFGCSFLVIHRRIELRTP